MARPTLEEASRGRAHVAALRSQIRSGAPRCRACAAERHVACRGSRPTGPCGCDCPEGANKRRTAWRSPRIGHYRKRPLEVMAVRYDGSALAAEAVAELAGEDYDGQCDAVIHTAGGSHVLQPGQWAVRRIGDDRLAVYDDERFNALFFAVEVPA